MKIFTFGPLLVLLLVSCAGVAPTSLRTPTTPYSRVIATEVSYQEYYRLAGNTFKYTLLAGTYSAKYEDDSGSYLEGPGKCFKIQVVTDEQKKKGGPFSEPQSYRCGIHISHDVAQEPRIYFYRDPEVHRQIFSNTTVQAVDAKGVLTPSAGAGIGVGIAAAIDAAELDNLHFYNDQPPPGVLRAALRPQ